MLNFNEELEKYKPILEIDYLEEHIATEDLSDVIELIKEGMGCKGVKGLEIKDLSDKEL